MAEEIVARATQMAHYMYNPHHAAAAAAAAASMPFPHGPPFHSAVDMPPFYPPSAHAHAMHMPNNPFAAHAGSLAHNHPLFNPDPDRSNATPPPGTYPPGLDPKGRGDRAAAAAAGGGAAGPGAHMPMGMMGLRGEMERAAGRDHVLAALPGNGAGPFAGAGGGWQRVSSLEQLQKRMRVGEGGEREREGGFADHMAISLQGRGRD